MPKKSLSYYKRSADQIKDKKNNVINLPNTEEVISYRKDILPKTDKQKELIESIIANVITFAIGPAGTGKTFVSVRTALDNYFLKDKIDRLLITRPAIEASGENLGYLPGNLQEKMSPYLRPIYDILSGQLGYKQLNNFLTNQSIEIAPAAYMRGRTINNSILIIDEAQNYTKSQLKMLLTRLGYGSKIIITGDPDQSDISDKSGLLEVVESLKLVDSSFIGFVEFDSEHIVRHPLISTILKAI